MTKYIKALSLFLTACIAISCGKDNDANFTLKGNIKGLKKGMVYLQKNGDSTDIIDLDSVAVMGEKEFVLQTNLKEPILLYLKLFKNDGEEHYIPFFGDKGETTINTSLKLFSYDAEIKGSKTQDLLNEYTKVMSNFKDQNLEIIEQSLLAKKANDTIASDSLKKRSTTLIKRKYAYTIQFALNHKDNIIAPYLALYEVPAANTVYIDSIYNGLTKDIKTSFYGKKLAKLIETRANIE
ncbi:DUF4369 domain-containing protein [uncultured Winogradskyella sp.]|uniref:DUF4369 domain-containing protein n=1 Tax=uncultured Winogradskyella sp. TaxID=395353 RepID=UPI00262A3D54|nr:DUF4369 domain-containing protein [uncultured Winogradskyella sp.]